MAGYLQYRLEPKEGESPAAVFEPWVEGNTLGLKTFLLQLDSEGIVVGKLWDRYKHDSKGRDREMAIYLKLHTVGK